MRKNEKMGLKDNPYFPEFLSVIDDPDREFCVV